MWLALLLLAAEGASPEGARTEVGFVPLVGGDTDVGVGAGFLAGVASVAPGLRPYRWRVESAAFFTFKMPSGRGIEAPYQDAFVQLTLPNLAGGRVRLELRPSFTRETNLRYYGVGNAAPAPPEDMPERDFYRRVHPTLAARVRLPLGAGVFAMGGTRYTWNVIDYDPQSALARDQQDERLRGLLLVDRRFGLHLVEAGLGLDRRDDEIAPSSGQYHTARVRVSPSGIGDQPFEYVQATLVLRGYRPFARGRLVAAARLVADGLFGSPPFFELGRFGEDASALGGANGVRGIPADRYLGKRKLFGNLELRAALRRAIVRGSEYVLGAVAFLDGGRVWADVRPAPALDGRGLGLRYGAGGGLRLQKGGTFVIRADVAWSPDARPVGGYFLAGHLF